MVYARFITVRVSLMLGGYREIHACTRKRRKKRSEACGAIGGPRWICKSRSRPISDDRRTCFKRSEKRRDTEIGKWRGYSRVYSEPNWRRTRTHRRRSTRIRFRVRKRREKERERNIYIYVYLYRAYDVSTPTPKPTRRIYIGCPSFLLPRLIVHESFLEQFGIVFRVLKIYRDDVVIRESRSFARWSSGVYINKQI